MISIQQAAPYELILMEIDPISDLGAPADPTYLRASMTFAQTRHCPDTATFFPAQWQTDPKPDPPKHYTMCPIGVTSSVGQLALGVWWPYTRVESNPEILLLAGEPFRII